MLQYTIVRLPHGPTRCVKKNLIASCRLPASSRGFQTEFAEKAWSDLLAYEEIKAANEAKLADLLERPHDDIVTEEIIDQLPGPKVEDLTTDEPLKVKVERLPMQTESTDPEQMDTEGGSMEPGSVEPKVEEDDAKMEDATGQSLLLRKNLGRPLMQQLRPRRNAVLWNRNPSKTLEATATPSKICRKSSTRTSRRS